MTNRSFESTSQTLSPDTYRQFKVAIETGKWPDGNVVSDKQRGLMLEAVILYEHANMPADQHSGAMPDQCRSASDNSDDQNHSDDTQTITLQ